MSSISSSSSIQSSFSSTIDSYNKLSSNYKLASIFLILIIISFTSLFVSSNINEHFIWNIPTRWNNYIYDIRGYPRSYPYDNYYFIHNGKLFNNNYINLNTNPNLWNWLPYYNNGMIYSATGSYKFDEFSKYYPNYPIIYPTQVIDWQGLANNGLITI